MQYQYFTVALNEIVPQQHYLSAPKLAEARQSLLDYETYGDIYVILYRDRIFSVDGHHRLYALWEAGINTLDVVNEIADNDHRLYQLLADEALTLGLHTIADLGSRIVATEAEFQACWVDKCQQMLRELNAT